MQTQYSIRRDTNPERQRLLNIWHSMRARCLMPNSDRYRYYGARGIRICDEWMQGFEFFRKWALANGYAANLSIERLDNDAGYSPENCVWATQHQQTRNMRRNRHITAFGETKTVVDWVDDERCVVMYTTLLRRLNAGWDPERAITNPPLPIGRWNPTH